jgi:hypothetical protein
VDRMQARSRVLPMLASPSDTPGRVLVLAAFAALAAAFAIAHAHPIAAQPASQRLTDLWALEVTPEFFPSVGPRLVARTRQRGINAIVLNRHLSREQKRRVRSLARRFHLPTFQPRRLVCKRETVEMCAVVARTPAAVERLAREPFVDIVVLRLRRPTVAPALSWESEAAADGGATARLMLLPTLTAGPRFSPTPWRRTLSAVANARRVDLGVTPSGRSGARALKLYLGLLAGTTSNKSPTGTGGVVFTGDFETGNVSQWTWGAQCANTSSARMNFTRGTVTVQSEIVAQGRYAARIDLPAAPNDKTACETLSKRQIGVGTDDYYGLMVRFPRGWREPSSLWTGLWIAQFNYQGIAGSPVILAARADHIALILQSGLCRAGVGCAYSSGPGGNVKRMLALPAPMALGVWHELIVHVRWTTDSSGVIEVWHRTQGRGGWSKTVSLSGYPTVQWTSEEGRQTIAASVTSDKIGAYRAHADFPLTVWHDGFVRARSFASAASAMP